MRTRGSPYPTETNELDQTRSLSSPKPSMVSHCNQNKVQILSLTISLCMTGPEYLSVHLFFTPMTNAAVMRVSFLPSNMPALFSCQDTSVFFWLGILFLQIIVWLPSPHHSGLNSQYPKLK